MHQHDPMNPKPGSQLDAFRQRVRDDEKRAQDEAVRVAVGGIADRIAQAQRAEGLELKLGAPLQEAKRFNSGKTPMGSIPYDLLDGTARVMAKGEVKYGRANYRAGYDDLMNPYNSLMRHATCVQRAIESGKFDDDFWTDPESGEAHLHHIITSALLLIHAARLRGIRA